MPSAEIIAIGTEILLGQITDTNSRFLSEELARLGVNCFYHTTVGDNPDRIVDVLRCAFNRSEIILTTGGLGPTPDDLTMECLARAFGSELTMDEVVLEELKQYFKGRAYSMPEANKKQALRPMGAQLLPNNRGTAPGIIWEINRRELAKKNIFKLDDAKYDTSSNCTVITFPGVPHEMKHMWRDTACDYISSNIVKETIHSVELKHIGIGESSLAEKYQELLSGVNPTVAPYAGRGECRLRVTGKAKTKEEAEVLIEPVVEKIIQESGFLFYGRDDETLESVVAELLSRSSLTISLAESCTGGLVSKRLTDVAGSSKYISLNLVTYSNEAKMKELNVPEKVLLEDGAVSSACAEAMAKGARIHAGADIGVGITGIAGPSGGTKDKPVGLVYLGLSSENKVMTKELNLGERSSRSEIRFRTSNECLNMIRIFLLENYGN